MVQDWVIEEGQHGRQMVMKGPWSSAALEAARSHGVKELELNHAKGWKGRDLSFLRDLANLEAFTIIDFTVDDVGPVNQLTALRFLDVNTYCKTELSFSQFPRLEECSLEWRPKASSLFEHRRVKRLFINNYPGKDLTAFSGMTSLESLSLASPRIETCAGVEALTGLTFLGLYVTSRLTTLEGIETLTKLVQLEVNDCPKVRDISPVASLRRLKELHLCNDGELKTIKPLAGLRHLERFLFYESTNVMDGDLTVLKSLPKLKAVAFMERPHYSHSREELPVS